MATITLKVNRQAHTLECASTTLLVEALREHLRLTGTHVGCDTSQCGACTVHVEGMAVKSCTMLAVPAGGMRGTTNGGAGAAGAPLAAQGDGRRVTTIEGMADGEALHPLQTAFWEKHGLQCGFCTPGMIMVTAD